MKTKYVLVFLFGISLNNILLIRKKRPDWQAGCLNGLGGHINEGETAVIAAIREVKEECNVSLRPFELEHIELLEGINYEIHCFGAQANLSEWKTMTDEVVECMNISRIFEESELFVPEVQRLASKAVCLLSK